MIKLFLEMINHKDPYPKVLGWLLLVAIMAIPTAMIVELTLWMHKATLIKNKSAFSIIKECTFFKTSILI